MQEDMHFYGVYAMARAAGLQPGTARTIAWASQFVDDALEGDVVNGGDYGVVLPMMTSHKPLDYRNAIARDQWEVWVCFHFLPGKQGNSLEEKLVCRRDSPQAQAMLKHPIAMAAQPFGPHLAGITAHVYADTFSHFGFSGIHHEWNKVKARSIKVLSDLDEGLVNYLDSKLKNLWSRVQGSLAETVPVGHGSVGTYPDRPYLRWEYEYECHPDPKKPRAKVARDNAALYLEGCRALHAFFGDFARAAGQGGGARQWGDISEAVEAILRESGDKKERIALWLRAYVGGSLFDYQPEDQEAVYDESSWQPGKIVSGRARRGAGATRDPELFIQAARLHRAHVLGTLLADMVII